ncbi:MAG: hypothetical protein BMS9Abin33_0602 [Gammaproteobacteria bacterium]|nr:MAG: hypothetical protein BMS9Abin33_0602 [Gammaproteobacteria bacterium]
MIGLLHGYHLEGSGSNLWTRYMAQALCRQGETLHLICQEDHPERFDFIAEAYRYAADGSVIPLLRRDTPYPGRCILHQPELVDILPVYVAYRSLKRSRAVPMVELSDEKIEEYLQINTRVVHKVVEKFNITVLHANHAVLQSVVAERVSKATAIPFAIMPHGSAIEYVVKQDPRFLRLASEAFAAAQAILFVGPEMKQRLIQEFSSVPGLKGKLRGLNLGVDTDLFKPIQRHLRNETIQSLLEKLVGVPRGKTPGHWVQLTEKLSANITEKEFKHALLLASPEKKMVPDEDIVEKLEPVDWEQEKILLFVGRLIANKGLPALIAALPLILEQTPQARLLVVGHGPLREVMEAWLWALGQGEQRLMEKFVRWGSPHEDTSPEPFQEVLNFFQSLERRGELAQYFGKAKKVLHADRVLFLGYLEHALLRYLFPCGDVAIFPSVIPEAGPLVFLEALASGCFPIGTYFGGMAASIDSVSEILPQGEGEWMKISARPEETVADLAHKVPVALGIGDRHRQILRQVAEERYDWSGIAKNWSTLLHSLA